MSESKIKETRREQRQQAKQTNTVKLTPSQAARIRRADQQLVGIYANIGRQIILAGFAHPAAQQAEQMRSTIWADLAAELEVDATENWMLDGETLRRIGQDGKALQVVEGREKPFEERIEEEVFDATKERP